jgi:hypothetical protein
MKQCSIGWTAQNLLAMGWPFPEYSISKYICVHIQGLSKYISRVWYVNADFVLNV